uniref:Uncharacterized protein n=1 Tax=Cannabis sativa TaxID=3483 RepID=A0A803Q8P8_CANSA
MGLLNRFLGHIQSRSEEVLEIARGGGDKGKKSQASGGESQQPAPPTLNPEAASKALSKEAVSTSIIDMTEPILVVEPLRRVHMENTRGDNSDYDGPVVINKKWGLMPLMAEGCLGEAPKLQGTIRSSNTTLAPRVILATFTQLSRERTELPPLPLAPFTLLVKTLSMTKGENACLEAVEQFYQKRCGIEYKKMKKLTNSISSIRNAEFVDYNKWDEACPPLVNRVEMTKKLCPHIEIDVLPFLPDLLELRATTSYRLGADRFTMMGSSDAMYVDLMVERNRSMVIQLAYDLGVLMAKHANVELRREKATNALAEANAKMEATINSYQNKRLGSQLEAGQAGCPRERPTDYHPISKNVEEAEAETIKRADDAETKLNASVKANEESMKRVTEVEDKEDQVPKILALEEADKTKEVAQGTKAINPGTTVPIGVNVGDFALLASKVPISNNPALPKVSSDVPTKNAQSLKDLA